MSQENIDLPPPPPPAGKRNMKIIALATICIVLAATLVGVIAVYQPTSLQTQIKDKDSLIKVLNENITQLQTQLATTPNVTTYIMEISSLEAQWDSMNSSLSDTTNQLYALQNITALQESTILNQQQGTIDNNTSSDAFNDIIDYAGYINVQATSTSNTTYIETIYSNFGLNFDQNVTTGTLGTAVFPALPGTLEVKIGNPDTTPITASVTITYYY